MAIAFGQMGAGDKLFIQSYQGTGLEFIVRGDAAETPELSFLTVMLEGAQGARDFIVGQPAMLFTAELGDVPVEEVARHFEDDVQCSTSIGVGYWVSLVQGSLVGLLRVRSIAFEK